MTTITITLPDDLVKQAKSKGLLSSAAIERYVREKLREMETENDDSNENIEFDPQLEGLVNPKVYRKGKIVGDIIGPFPEEWGENE